MSKRVCTMCDEPKDIEEFALRNQFTQRRQSYCKDCYAKMSGRWYERNKDYQRANANKHSVECRKALREYVLEYLLTHPCSASRETDPVVLEFHHARGPKVTEISTLIGRGSSLEKRKGEIEKCDVVCANCHRRLTARERGFFRR